MQAVVDVVKRAPVIRHIRAMWASYQVERHYSAWSSIGFFPARRDEDERHILRIWRGEE